VLGCIKKYRIDIYQQIPLNSKLTKETLLHSNQIFRTQSGLILLFDASKNPEYYDPHLLFFNDANILYGASYYASEKIDSIKKDVIYGVLNADRDKRKSRYRNDLPANYTLNLALFQGMRGRMGNKIVEEIKLNDSGTVVQLEVIEAEDRYILAGKNLDDINLNFLRKFKHKNTTTFKINDLLFDSEHGIIQTRGLNEKNELKSEFLVVKNAQLMDDFFEELWEKLNLK
jgi:hypothetical protein